MPKPQSELPNNQVTAHSSLEKWFQRRLTTEYKLRILAEADQCQHGELGALLRRKNPYSSQFTTRRRELDLEGTDMLGKTSSGPNAAKTPGQKLIEQLEKERAINRRKLEIT